MSDGMCWLTDEGEAPEEAASRWREGVLEDAGASSSFAGVFKLDTCARQISAPPIAAVRQQWSPAAAQVAFHLSHLARIVFMFYWQQDMLIRLFADLLTAGLLTSTLCECWYLVSEDIVGCMLTSKAYMLSLQI